MLFRLQHPARLPALLLGCSVGLVLTTSARASGTYPPAPPQLQSEVARSIDPQVYNLGKSIFNGRATTSTPTPAALATANAQRIQAVVDRIPARARAKINVTQLAHQLEPADVDALLYYLELRFRTGEGVS